MRKPLATYRLQLHSGFGFDAAADIADYLSALGVSHVYSSPYLQAMPGSTHGYDVADHHRVNAELGDAGAHDRFCLRLGAAQLGQVLDIVPNHMAIGGRANAWWWDVLENGLASPYAAYFDIDWQSPEERLRNKVLLPILGDHYGRVLKRGEITIRRESAEFVASYFDHELPVAPETVAALLAQAALDVREHKEDSVGAEALGFLADSLARLPNYIGADANALWARNRDKKVIGRWLKRLLQERPAISNAVDGQLAALNGNPDALHAMLEGQNYRVAYWKAASRDLGYRRFFDINTLVGLRMEDRRVFEDTHSLILDWLRRGVLDGVRVDHPDGLRDPREYFRRLRASAPDAWIVAEKILEPGEPLREDWPVQGTTGYDFLNVVNGLFIDARSERAFTEFYEEFTGRSGSFEQAAYEKKTQVLRDVLGSDINRLVSLLREICEFDRDHRDYTAHELRHALRTLVACYPVYRTYIVPEAHEVTAADEECIDRACQCAKRSRPDLDPDIFNFLRDVLSLRIEGELIPKFVGQFQQFTGPAMAKGVEDTAFYTYNRFAGLNEVGADPGRFGVSPEDFHAFCMERQRLWPDTQLAGSTHDTKRSEDVRARLALLSEIPDQWREAVTRWAQMNAGKKTGGAPDANTEYLLYQTLVGAWPIGIDRIQAYMLKAAREAKEVTSWIEPNEPFETALREFVSNVMGDAAFTESMARFAEPLIPAGRTNSLAQTLIRLMAPGVPDLYQGTELWDLSLVDPDNRRPVDYGKRRELLAELDRLSIDEVMARSDEGLPKLWLIRQVLRVRRMYPDGAYAPLATGANIVAFRRGENVLVAVPRLAMSGVTPEFDLPEGSWRNMLTGSSVTRGEPLFRQFPVALLVKGHA